jgi:hypothetical protein
MFACDPVSVISHAGCQKFNVYIASNVKDEMFRFYVLLLFQSKVTVVTAITWNMYLNLHLSMKSMSITTLCLSSILPHGMSHSLYLYVIRFRNDLPCCDTFLSGFYHQ